MSAVEVDDARTHALGADVDLPAVEMQVEALLTPGQDEVARRARQGLRDQVGRQTDESGLPVDRRAGFGEQIERDRAREHDPDVGQDLERGVPEGVELLG